MIFPWLLIAACLVPWRYIICGKEDDELKAVIVLFRHGDRSPLNSWPTDTYYGNSSLWPDGYGQLNNMGKQRLYKLGQWLRNRYDGFLSRRYNRRDIYVKSTDVDRTLMSAASNLAGLFPPEGDQVWNNNIPWQAIPIHTLPESSDPILTTPFCPKHEKLYNELLNSKEIQKLNKELANLYKNISEATGITDVDIPTFFNLYSTLVIYRGLNFSLPAWTDKYWPEIKQYSALANQLYTYTEDMTRLRVGPFFDYLLNHFDLIKNNIMIEDKYISCPDQEASLIIKRVNYTLPEWTDKYWDLINYWRNKMFKWVTSFLELALLRTKPFFRNHLNYLDFFKTDNLKEPEPEEIPTSPSNAPKFLMLSAHDSTIINRMNALGVYPGALPEFASTIIWELKRNFNEIYVNMYFKNSTNFNKVVLPQCEFDCSLEDFANILKPLRRSVEEWTAECHE